MPTPEGTGAKLKQARERAGLTQAQAAQLAKVHKVSVARWEGGRAIGAEDLRKLARAYGTTAAELLGDEGAGEGTARGSADYFRGRQDALREVLANVTAMLSADTGHEKGAPSKDRGAEFLEHMGEAAAEKHANHERPEKKTRRRA